MSRPAAHRRSCRRAMSSRAAAMPPPPPPRGCPHTPDPATHLPPLEQSLREPFAVDSARVAQLQSAIEQGRYTVDAGNVASQLMQMERALASLGKKGE